MGRPKKSCLINQLPGTTYFKPRGIPVRELSEVYLPFEGYEAIRLVDRKNLNHSQAAAQMGISRQTFGRILTRARNTVAQALVDGLALHIQGGQYKLKQDAILYPRRPKLVSGSAKVAISSTGPTLKDPLDPRFGRAAGFTLVDPATRAVVYLDNGANQAEAQGAGIKTAEQLIAAGVTVVLTGYVGPKAFEMLVSAGIQIGQNLENLTAGQALDRYLDHQIDFAAQPNRTRPWE